LFVTHDRYLVQKIATNLLYIEGGEAHVFDRLSAFEEWLEGGRESNEASPAAPPGVSQKERAGLSKNKKEQLQKEVLQLEEKIATLEGELAEIELSFQNPATGTDWESTHQRYARLKTTLENLYEDLARRWELMN
jgi:ATP-binding cassette subfamily F protein 3